MRFERKMRQQIAISLSMIAVSKIADMESTFASTAADCRLPNHWRGGTAKKGNRVGWQRQGNTPKRGR